MLFVDLNTIIEEKGTFDEHHNLKQDDLLINLKIIKNELPCVEISETKVVK